MPNCRCAFIPGGTWFFTVKLLQRHGNDLLVREIDVLRHVVRRVRERCPFHIDAWVVLPEHFVVMWRQVSIRGSGVVISMRKSQGMCDTRPGTLREPDLLTAGHFYCVLTLPPAASDSCSQCRQKTRMVPLHHAGLL